MLDQLPPLVTDNICGYLTLTRSDFDLIALAEVYPKIVQHYLSQEGALNTYLYLCDLRDYMLGLDRRMAFLDRKLDILIDMVRDLSSTMNL